MNKALFKTGLMAGIAAVVITASGCATVVRGTKETARFESQPAGATVTVESISEDRLGPYSCTTPCELELKRKRTWTVDYEMEGRKPVQGRLKPQVTGGGVASGAGNILAGGIIGIGVDAGTGANLDLRPNPLIAVLVPVDSDAVSTVNSVNPVAEDEPAPEPVVEPAAEPVGQAEPDASE